VHEEKSRGVYVKGLTQYNVSEAAEVYQIMKQGQASRATSSTSEFPGRALFQQPSGLTLLPPRYVQQT
jgi:hypothetical protein